MVCPWAMSFFQKLCLHALFLSTQCCLYNLLDGQPENSWPLGGKYCITSNPSRYSGLHLLCFLQHVWQQHLAVDPLGWVTGTQCLLEAHQLVANLPGWLGFQVQCLPLRGLALQAIWARTLTILLLKLQTYPLDQIPIPFLWHIWSVVSYFVLKPLTNSYNQDPAPL